MISPFNIEHWQCNPYNNEWTIAYLMVEGATVHSKKPVFFDHNNIIYSHQDLAQMAGSVRSELYKESQLGDAIACITTLDLPCYVSIQAVITSGRVYVPIDAHSPHDRNLKCIEQSGARLILTSADCKDQAIQLAGENCKVIVIEENIDNTVGVPTFVAPSNPAAYIFTSGSTGVPKAVIRSQKDLAHAVYSFTNTYNYTADDVILLPGSPVHIGSFNLVLSSMVCGYSMVTIDIASVNVMQILRLLTEWKVTLLDLSPSLLRLLVPAIAHYDKQLYIRSVVTSGEALYRSDVANFFQSRLAKSELWQNYGSTETGPMYAGKYSAKDGEGSGPLPLRVAADACVIQIIKSNGSFARVNEVGNLLICSEYLSSGYLTETSDLGDKFSTVEDDEIRTYQSADQGFYSESNELFILGRSDEQINIHGRRYETGEIESAILEFNNIIEAIVSFNNRDGSDDELNYSLIAVISLDNDEILNISDLKEYLKTKLPKAAVPEQYIIVDKVLKTATGKVNRSWILQQVATHLSEISVGKGGPPQGTVENWIADCWQELLKINRPGRHDKLEDLGADSIVAIELARVLEQRFGFYFNIDEVLSNQTIASQCHLIKSRKDNNPDVIITLRDDKIGPRLVLIPGFGGHAWNFQEIATRFMGPCTIQVVSIDALFIIHQENLDIEHIIQYIAEEIIGSHPKHELWIGGYSAGANIACHIVDKVQSLDNTVNGLLLIEPAGLRSVKWLTYYRNKLKSRLANNVLTRLFVKASTLELNFVLLRDRQRKLFSQLPLVLPPIPLHLLLCENSKFESEQTFLKRISFTSTCFITRLKTSHLGIMQLPMLQKTTEWLENIVNKATHK